MKREEIIEKIIKKLKVEIFVDDKNKRVEVFIPEKNH